LSFLFFFSRIDAIRLVETENSEKLNENFPYLDENFQQINYMHKLADIFMNHGTGLSLQGDLLTPD
jgi:hypothetical protein